MTALDHALFFLLNGSDSIILDHFALVETAGLAWAPFLLTVFFFLLKSNNYRKTLFVLVLLGVLYLSSSVLVSSVFQPYFGRLRPGQDLSLIHLVDLVDGRVGGIHGFFSDQASLATAFTVFMALLVRCLPFTLTLTGWVLLKSWVLAYLGYYFPTDLLAGWLWGAFIGVILYFVYLKIGRLFLSFTFQESTQSTSSGYLLDDVYFSVTTFLVNVVLLMIFSFLSI